MKRTRSAFILGVVFAIQLAQHSYAQSPNPQRAPVDVDKLCASVGKDEQTDIAVQCAAARTARTTADGANLEGTVRLIPATTCAVSAGLCIGGITAGIGEIMSYVCAGTSAGASVFEKVKEGNIAGSLVDDIKAQNWIGAGMGAVDAARDVKDIVNLAKGAPKTGPGCILATIGAVTEIGTVAMDYYTGSTLGDTEKTIKDGIAQMVDAGNMPDLQGFKDLKDLDGEKLDKPDFKLDADLEAKLEEMTGMSSKDFLNYQGDPEALIAKILERNGAPPESFEAAKKIFQKGAGDKKQYIAAKGRPLGNTNGTDALGTSGFGYGAGGELEGGRGLAGAKKFKGDGSKLFKDPSLMTREELEIDRFHDIFLRVTRRYEAKAPLALELLPWALKSNQLANSKNKPNPRTPSGGTKLRFTQ